MKGGLSNMDTDLKYKAGIKNSDVSREENILGWYKFAKSCQSSSDIGNFRESLEHLTYLDSEVFSHKESLTNVARRFALGALLNETRNIREAYKLKIKEDRSLPPGEFHRDKEITDKIYEAVIKKRRISHYIKACGNSMIFYRTTMILKLK